MSLNIKNDETNRLAHEAWQRPPEGKPDDRESHCGGT